MRNLTIILLVLNSGVTWSQVRAFDNSKAILPWIYNPSANFTSDFQAYVGYDGRGNGNFMPQSIVGGFRMPVEKGRRVRGRGHSSIMGVQVLKTSQDILKSSTINASFAHQITLTRKLKVALGLGAGVSNMKYHYDALVYFDPQDPLLNNGENFFNIHLNAGFSLVLEDKLMIDLAAPYLMKDHRANIKEIIFRISYIIPFNPDVNLITSANLDTYNHNMVFGGDLRMEWKKMISFMVGADRYKYHGGLLLNVKPFSLGYTYGLNYSNVIDYVPAHQLSVFSNIPFLK